MAGRGKTTYNDRSCFLRGGSLHEKAFHRQTTKLGWVGVASGPICLGMSSETLFSVTKNKVYRFELTLEGSELAITVPGLYDIYVSVVPNIKALTPILAGNGGMSTATARMKLNN